MDAGGQLLFLYELESSVCHLNCALYGFYISWWDFSREVCFDGMQIHKQKFYEKGDIDWLSGS